MSLLEALEREVHLDIKTGDLYWCRKGGPRRSLGVPLNTTNTKGYKTIALKHNGSVKTVGQHRLVHFMVTGEDPEVVDHINQNPADNRPSNLRSASIQQNTRNRKVNRNNLLGIRGVQKRGSRYRSRIRVDGRLINLGTFETLCQAQEARRGAELKYGEGYHPH